MRGSHPAGDGSQDGGGGSSGVGRKMAVFERAVPDKWSGTACISASVVGGKPEARGRGAEDSEAKVRRFQEEIEYMREHWIDILKNGDPYYNKNLSLTKWNYSLRPLKGMDSKGKDRR